MMIGKFHIKHYFHSKIFEYFKLKNGFHLDIFWITITYPVTFNIDKVNLRFDE